MSPGEEQHSTISEDTTLVGQSKPSIGKQHRPYHLLFHNDSIWRHAVVVVCMCVCELSEWVILWDISQWSLKIKDWNVQSKHNALLSWNENGEFWIRGCIVKLWRDLLGVVNNWESSEVLVNYCLLWKVHLYHKINGDPGESLSLRAA